MKKLGGKIDKVHILQQCSSSYELLWVLWFEGLDDLIAQLPNTHILFIKYNKLNIIISKWVESNFNLSTKYFTDADIDLVMAQSECKEQEAVKALIAADGDVITAIVKLINNKISINKIRI